MSENSSGSTRGDARPPPGARVGERPREPLQQRPDDPIPERKKPASGVLIHRGEPTLVFLTVCTEHRRPWLAQPTAHDHLRAVWNDSRAWLVGRYVLMPDHLHLFCAPGEQDIPFNQWMSYWKRLFTRRTRNPAWAWQSLHWDTRLRRNENYDQKWDYVVKNPERAGLVERFADWPYQGELNELRW